jgi:hypothetical protein
MIIYATTGRIGTGLIVGAVSSFLFTACAEKNVIPITCEPEISLTDIAGGTLEQTNDECHLVESGRSEGRFPGGLAVARLKVAEDITGDSGKPVELKPLKDQEAAYWNHLFDNVRWVRETFELTPKDVQTRVVTAKPLIEAAGRLNASLCLLYGHTDTEDFRSLVVGALYDTRSQKLLATIKAECSGVNDWLPERPAGRPQMDNRHQDNHYLAARKFEKLVHGCVRDLVALDRPKREEKPSGWIEPLPTTMPAMPGRNPSASADW